MYLPSHNVLLPPPLDIKLVTCQLTPGQGASPPKTSAVPLSILELRSVDEKSKSAVTKPGLLSSAVLTVQSRNKKKKERKEVRDYLGANTGTADCLRLWRTGGLHNRHHCKTSVRGRDPSCFSPAFYRKHMPPHPSKFILLSLLWL